MTAWDTQGWRTTRDQALQAFLQNSDAVNFFVGLGNFTEVIDDLVDRDRQVDESELFAAMQFVLCDMPFNRFFNAFDRELRGQMLLALGGWFESERLKNGTDNDKVVAYTLRDLSHEMLFTAGVLLRGYSAARAEFPSLRELLTNDSFDEYKREHLCL